ncbi:hypothetical protein [Shewanella piezotolerans]|nr:hypothetical protein [Shewanella piezotolerans]
MSSASFLSWAEGDKPGPTTQDGVTVVGKRPSPQKMIIESSPGRDGQVHSTSTGGTGENSRNEPPKEEKQEEPEEEKETKEKCEADSDTKYATCNATQSAIYRNTLTQSCAGRGTVSAGGNAVYVEAGVSFDSYTQCKDIAQADRNNALHVCTVFQTNRIASCL